MLIFKLAKNQNALQTTNQPTMKECQQCQSPYGYLLDQLYLCPECGHEWNPEEVSTEDALIVKDANGNALENGDSVVVIKDLPVKGASK